MQLCMSAHFILLLAHNPHPLPCVPSYTSFMYCCFLLVLHWECISLKHANNMNFPVLSLSHSLTHTEIQLHKHAPILHKHAPHTQAQTLEHATYVNTYTRWFSSSLAAVCPCPVWSELSAPCLYSLPWCHPCPSSPSPLRRTSQRRGHLGVWQGLQGHRAPPARSCALTGCLTVPLHPTA